MSVRVRHGKQQSAAQCLPWWPPVAVQIPPAADTRANELFALYFRVEATKGQDVALSMTILAGGRPASASPDRRPGSAGTTEGLPELAVPVEVLRLCCQRHSPSWRGHCAASMRRDA